MEGANQQWLGDVQVRLSRWASFQHIKATLKQVLPETRAYDGCQGIDTYGNLEDGNNLLFLERWNSRKHHEKYLAWRTSTGFMEKLGAALTGPPSMRYFERVDA